MPGEFFKSLAEYLKASQQEWLSGEDVSVEEELEHQREEAYEAGIQAMQHGRFEAAVDLLKKAAESRRYRKDAYYYLAECYQYLQMIPLARKTYERLIRLDYHFRDVHEKMRALDAPKRAMPTGLAVPGQQETRGTAITTVSPAATDRYEILDTIHESQHARIYRVRDTILGRIVALKHVDRHYPDRTAYLQQLKERTALKHSNILRIYDIDEDKGQVTMEYVEGRDLRYTLGLEGRLAHKIIIHIAIQLVNGLHHAHSRDVVHHALTPEHVLLTHQCEVKITAFRAPDSFVRVQKTDDPYKYLYVPPELLLQGALTAASNIYSFGVILYEMFTEQTPFRLRQIKAFLHHQEPLEYDETLLPDGISPIIRRCLALEPEKRYPVIRVVGEELIRWFKTHQREKNHEQDIAVYRDYLLVAWADGRISKEEAIFLAHKRQELHITDQEAKTAEVAVKQELKALLRSARKR